MLILHPFDISLMQVTYPCSLSLNPFPKMLFSCMQTVQIMSDCYCFTKIPNWFIGFCLKLFCRDVNGTTQ